MPALLDGVRLADRPPLTTSGTSKSPSTGTGSGCPARRPASKWPYTHRDVTDPLETELLLAIWEEAARLELDSVLSVAGIDDPVAKAVTPAPWPLPDRDLRHVRLQTLGGRRTALLVWKDGNLHMVDADADRLVGRVHLGTEVRDVVALDDGVSGV